MREIPEDWKKQKAAYLELTKGQRTYQGWKNYFPQLVNVAEPSTTYVEARGKRSFVVTEVVWRVTWRYYNGPNIPKSTKEFPKYANILMRTSKDRLVMAQQDVLEVVTPNGQATYVKVWCEPSRTMYDRHQRWVYALYESEGSVKATQHRRSKRKEQDDALVAQAVTLPPKEA